MWPDAGLTLGLPFSARCGVFGSSLISHTPVMTAYTHAGLLMPLRSKKNYLKIDLIEINTQLKINELIKKNIISWSAQTLQNLQRLM